MSYWYAAAAASAAATAKRYGPNLIVNGDGSNLTGWSNTSGQWVVSGGRFYHASSSNYSELSQGFAAQTGNFLIEADIEVLSGSNTAEYFYINAAGTVFAGTNGGIPFPPVGKSQIRLVVSGGVQKIGFCRVTTAHFYVSNVKVRRIL